MKFPCIQCGLCCRNIKYVEPLSEFNDGEGVCLHLKNNRCDIYNTRPVYCNVELLYTSVFNNVFSEEDYIIENMRVCYHLNEMANNYENCEKIKKLLNDYRLKA